MNAQVQTATTEKFSYSSSISDDIWHPQSDAKAYEWWYFDALSDDGREGIVVIFLDNFIFSPRYNKSHAKTEAVESKPARFPAVVLIYYKDGKPMYRAINEFPPEQFQADTEKPFCKLGDSEFSFKCAPYGSGYLLKIDAVLNKGLKMKANLEWLLVESDFLPKKNIVNFANSHNWNLVAPRCDVTGKIEIFKTDGKFENQINFRGTGYHDHNFDSRWLAETVSDWQWGRAHFTDCTAVFYRFKEIGDNSAITKLFLIKEGSMTVFEAEAAEAKHTGNLFGLKYPKQITFTTKEGYKLKIQQNFVIDSSFFYLRFLSEAVIETPRGETHEAFAMSEHLAPKALKYRWLDWLVDMRIGRNGKGSFLP